jgi:hypothetical protein
MEVCFKNEKERICLEIFLYSLKYINIFLIFYTKYARKVLYVLECAANQKSLRTTGLEEMLWTCIRWVLRSNAGTWVVVAEVFRCFSQSL